METIRVGILGCGTVGSGVIRLLQENADILSKRVGAQIVLQKACDVTPGRQEELGLAKGVFTLDPLSVVEDPEVDIIAELIGGKTVAMELISRALAMGKPVVTANKALLAENGNQLISVAMENQTEIGFEASVGGCMPIIKTLRESLSGNRIMGMTGILNGTCNYILTKITNEGCPFGEALSQAQEIGYAEADPTLDVEGFDTAHKLAIINGLAYGMQVNLKDIYLEGISGITPMDIAFAREFNYRIKLLAISKNHGDAVEARIHPAMIPFDNILSNVSGNLNAITITGDVAGDILLYGYGAGSGPTASAVVSDIVDIARNRITGAKNRIPIFSWQKEHIKEIPVLPVENIETNYYFRFAAKDRPGVLSRISGILGEHDISIKSVHQKGRKLDGDVPIVMLTHRAREKDVQKAFLQISGLDVVSGKPVLIRIEDEGLEE